jgi:hypothetical protein
VLHNPREFLFFAKKRTFLNNIETLNKFEPIFNYVIIPALRERGGAAKSSSAEEEREKEISAKIYTHTHTHTYIYI